MDNLKTPKETVRPGGRVVLPRGGVAGKPDRPDNPDVCDEAAAKRPALKAVKPQKQEG